MLINPADIVRRRNERKIRQEQGDYSGSNVLFPIQSIRREQEKYQESKHGKKNEETKSLNDILQLASYIKDPTASRVLSLLIRDIMRERNLT